ncbi:MAG: hypothetical protein ABEJ36_00140 [Candidatus Nanosalina sp.]
MTENLPYYDLRRQADKHLKTITRRDRYDFETEDVHDLDPEFISEDGFLYLFDERPAAVNGDVRTAEDSTVESAAAFLDGEFSDELYMAGLGFEDDGENYGAIAVHVDPENPNVLQETPYGRDVVASAITHVFNAREETDRVDIQVERYSNPEGRNTVR